MLSKQNRPKTDIRDSGPEKTLLYPSYTVHVYMYKIRKIKIFGSIFINGIVLIYVSFFVVDKPYSGHMSDVKYFTRKIFFNGKNGAKKIK